MSMADRPGMSAAIKTALADCLERWQPERIWVGFSGGGDSTALLLAINEFLHARQPRVPLTALHVNHGLHDDADSWAEHCYGLCERYGIDVVVEQAAVSDIGNLEANARKARYEKFAGHIGAAELLMLGHHRADQVETILQRLFSGRGLLPMRSEGAIGQGHFVRPLLDIPLEELKQYLCDQSEVWVEDPSNVDTGFDRNFLRHEIIPQLRARWRGLGEGILRVASQQRYTQAALVHSVARLGDQVALEHLPTEPGTRQAWLRAFLAARGAHAVSDRALHEFDQQLRSGQSATLHCNLGATLRVYEGVLYFVLATGQWTTQAKNIALGETLALPGGTLALKICDRQTPGAFVYPGALSIKPRQGGEYIKQGSAGKEKPVKRLLAEHRLRPWHRANYPLLYHNETLICVPNIATDPSYQKQAATHSEPCCHAVWQPAQAQLTPAKNLPFGN